ncbi:MAG: hypothetical protein PVJ49_13715, partial [Acidobacteriota bacterium]|jgi:hypothetical protein
VERGHTLLFAPDAVVQHHHLTSLRGLLRERFERGREFGRLRIEHDDWGTGKMLYMLTVTVLPLRLAKLVGRVTRNAFAAAVAVRLVVGLPVIVVAEAAWLAGEATTYAASLRGRRDGS